MHDLFSFLPGERVMGEKEDLIAFSYDATRHTGMPELVLRPLSSGEVCQIAKVCGSNNIPIVPRGAGTSLSGGPVPTKGCIVIDFTLMDSILDIDPENSLVTVQPGVVYDKLNIYLKDHDLFFPPDPGSSSVCTIGGMVSTNSSGIRAVKYGTTRDYVQSMEVVTAEGTAIRLGTLARKSSSGYDLKDLFIGSEGTLGLITEITLKLIRRPTHFSAASMLFNTLEEAGMGIKKLILSDISPSVLEIIDPATVDAVRRFSSIEIKKSGTLVLIETDGFDNSVEKRIQEAVKIMEKEGAADIKISSDEKSRMELWEARKAAFPALARYSPTLILEDITVPISSLPGIMKKIEEIAMKHELAIATFGHAGDGNLHPTFLVDQKNAEEMERAGNAIKELFHYCLSIGGTLSGEHGIGLEKKDHMRKEHEYALDVMKKIKNVLDPSGILNPGKVFE